MSGPVTFNSYSSVDVWYTMRYVKVEEEPGVITAYLVVFISSLKLGPEDDTLSVSERAFKLKSG